MINVDSNPRFTVIIPAKDRADYLHHTLRTCSLQEYDNLEVVVSDDGSTDHTREVVETAARKDPRIRYVSPGLGVGMRDNFEFALNQVKPGFVIALGADDGLLPYGISGMFDVLKASRKELLAWAPPIFSYPKAKAVNGQLAIYRHQRSKIIQSREFLVRQVKNLHYLSDIESPMCYVKGVTSTRLVENVRKRSPEGRFYACPTPDGYSGIVLAGEVSMYAFSGQPFSIYGASPSSQGMAYKSGDEQAKTRSENFYREVEKRPMHSELASQPYSPLITLMTADYILTTKDLFGWARIYPPLDYQQLLKKGLEELSHGLYAENRLSRELGILYNIAVMHGLGDYFRKMVMNKKRQTGKSNFEGNAISPKMIFLDCDIYEIHNIFDAAYAVHSFYHLVEKTSLRSIILMLVNSIRYRLLSFRKGGIFPPEDEWIGLHNENFK